MNQKDYDALIAKSLERRNALALSKRKDYTGGDVDVLKNFKEGAAEAGVDSLRVWLIYAWKHWKAIASYIKGRTESEPIIGRLDDLRNYVDLLEALIEEHKKPSDEDRVDWHSAWHRAGSPVFRSHEEINPSLRRATELVDSER